MNSVTTNLAASLLKSARSLLDRMVAVGKELQQNKHRLGELACEFDDKGLYRYVAGGKFSSFRQWMVYVGEEMLGISADSLANYMAWSRAAKNSGIPESVRRSVPVNAFVPLSKLPPAQMKKQATALVEKKITVKDLTPSLAPSRPTPSDYHFQATTTQERKAVRDAFQIARGKLLGLTQDSTPNEVFLGIMNFVNRELA